MHVCACRKARYFLTLDCPLLFLAAGMLHDFMSRMVFGQRLDFLILDVFFSLNDSTILWEAVGTQLGVLSLGAYPSPAAGTQKVEMDTLENVERVLHALWHCLVSLPVIKQSSSHSCSLPWSWNDKEENSNMAGKIHMRKPGRRKLSPYILTIFMMKHFRIKMSFGKMWHWLLSDGGCWTWPQAAPACQCQCSLQKQRQKLENGRKTSFEIVLGKGTGLDARR